MPLAALPRTRGLAILLFLLPAFASLSAQELSRSVVGSAGSYYSAVNVGNIHWTVGEIAVDRTANGLVLERGFHHGLYELIMTSTWSAPEIRLNVSAFPNPTPDEVNLSGDWENGDRMRITDLLGRPLVDRPLRTETDRVDLRRHPAGVYVLSVVRAGRLLKTFRIVRK